MPSPEQHLVEILDDCKNCDAVNCPDRLAAFVPPDGPATEALNGAENGADDYEVPGVDEEEEDEPVIFVQPNGQAILVTDNPELEFKSLQDEQFRVYTFPGGDHIIIQDPAALNVSASGGHRIMDRRGRSHYVPAGWIHLEWQVVPGKPAFAF